MAKSRTQRVVVTLTFDKPCTKAQAAKVFRDCVWGEFYPTPDLCSGAEKFKIRGARPAPEFSIDHPGWRRP